MAIAPGGSCVGLVGFDRLGGGMSGTSGMVEQVCIFGMM